jgi:hypothetical protein
MFVIVLLLYTHLIALDAIPVPGEKVTRSPEFTGI